MTLRLAGRAELGGFALELDLDVPAGQTLVVLGPNGAGKTTLLRLLAGMLPLSSGDLRLGDRVLDDGRDTWVPPERRRVGLVFQDYRLFPHLTARDNVAFGPRARGLAPARARALAGEWLSRMGLTELAGRRPAQLSGGQAQQVALARTLAADPQLLLLDEPLAALDAHTRLQVRAGLATQLRAFPGPVLLVTHDPVDAMVLADRLLVLEEGRVVQAGPPAEVARRPATQYVARLMGLNLYAGRLDPASRTVRLTRGGRLEVTPAEDETLTEAGPVLVTLRPSAVTLHQQRPVHASPRNVWPGRVASTQLVGDRVRVDVRGAPDALVDVTPAAVAELDLVPGAAVWLSAKATETQAYPQP